MTFNQEAFVEIMREVPAVVVVVAAETPEGAWRGMTASSFTSVSLDPLLVSVCVIRGSQMHRALERAAGYTFSVLAADQGVLSDHFAIPGVDAQAQWATVRSRRAADGGRWLEGAVAWMHCAPHTRFEAGDHTVFIGRVVNGELLQPGAPPLLYYQRGYHTIVPDDDVS